MAGLRTIINQQFFRNSIIFFYVNYLLFAEFDALQHEDIPSKLTIIYFLNGERSRQAQSYIDDGIINSAQQNMYALRHIGVKYSMLNIEKKLMQLIIFLQTYLLHCITIIYLLFCVSETRHKKGNTKLTVS